MKFLGKKRKITFVVFGVLIILFLNFYQKEVRNFFYLISAPLQKNLWRLGDKASDFFELITEMKNLKKENENLKSELQEILAKNAELSELKKENEILREALKIGLEKEFKLILAQVTGKDISQDFLITDKGAKDGIKVGLPAVTQQKTLVGRVFEVYENFSKIILISNRESAFDGKVATRFEFQNDGGKSDDEIYGLVKGKGNFKINFELLPKDKEIKEGDLIVTSAAGGIFPAGILVGKIEKVKKSDLEPFQQAEIKSAFDIKELESLFIITEY